MMNRGRSAALLLWQRTPKPQSIVGLRASTVFRPQAKFLSNESNSDASEKPKANVDPRMTEWIPPNRPLVGDKGYTHMYTEEDSVPTEAEELDQIEREVALLEEELELTEEEQLQRIEEELKIMDAAEEKTQKKKKKAPVQPQQTLDWMKTRRETLDGDSNSLTPSFGRPQQELEVKIHTLFTATEIMDFLSSLGGIDVNLVKDQVTNAHGDTRLGGGLRGIIFVTGSSTAHVRMLATSLVSELKRRKLNEVGVVGARHGAEGMADDDSTWMCVDCENYAVNIQDAPTRRMLDLESWWSKADPLAEYGLAPDNEDAIDDFVARNPVPAEYGRTGLNSWDDTINQLENKRWTAPHRAVVPKPRMGKRSRGNRKGRR